MKLNRKLLITAMVNISLIQTLTAGGFAARLVQAKWADKSDIANFVKRTDFDHKLKSLNKNVISNKTKQLLVEN